MKQFILFGLAGLIGLSFSMAQTMLIAHRGHSGAGSLMVSSEDNFGLPPSKEIFVQDTITQERLWVKVTDWGSDSAIAANAGYRVLHDSGVLHPHRDSVRWIRTQSERRRELIDMESIRLKPSGQ